MITDMIGIFQMATVEILLINTITNVCCLLTQLKTLKIILEEIKPVHSYVLQKLDFSFKIITFLVNAYSYPYYKL